MTGLPSGCATVAPGADPLVVRVEQTQATGQAVLDAVVHIEHSEAGFFRTNAPAFYQFAEWLKQPQPVPVFISSATTNGAVSLPRGLAMLWSLDQVKLAYKAGAASSNSVLMVLSPVEAMLSQANAWLVLSTNNTTTTH